MNHFTTQNRLARVAMTLLVALLTSTTAWAEEQKTLTVYDGTDNNGYVPFYGLYADTQGAASEFVIPSDQLGNMIGGTITAMKFYIKESAAEAWTGTHQVYIGEVEATTLTGITGPSSFTVVKTASFDATGTELTVTFDEPYTYGGDNLLIGTYVSEPGNYKTAYFYGVSQTGNSAWYRSKESYTGNGVKFLPKTTFTYTAGSGTFYNKPTNLTVSELTANGATITWTAPEGSPTGYAYQYKKASDSDWSAVTTITSTTIALTGLARCTNYQFRVKAVYSTDGESKFATTSFKTEYGQQSLPYNEGFEEGIGGWTLVDCSSGTGIINGAKRNGNYCFAFQYNKNPPQFLISPEFEGTMPMTVSFWYKVIDSDYPETFQVGYSTTTNDVDAFTWEDEITATDEDNWTQYNTAFPAGTKYVAIKYNSNDMYYLCLDDFEFDIADGFVRPANLAASEISNKSVKLSWTEQGTATAWMVAYMADGAADFTKVNAGTNPFKLTGLTPETTYTVKVRQAGETNNKWSDEITFTTDVVFPAPKAVAANNVKATTTDITWTGNDDVDHYEMEYGRINQALFNFDDGSLQGWTNLKVNTDGGQWFNSVDNPGGYDYSERTHSGSNFAMSYSFIDNDAAYNTNVYLVSPQSYQVGIGASLNFWYSFANPKYPDHMEVCIATTVNPTASDFTPVWISSGVSGWTEVNIPLDDYAGQTIWIAFHHQDYDNYEIWVDDITINTGFQNATLTYIGTVSSPYTLTDLEPGVPYTVCVRANYGEGNDSRWSSVTFTTPPADVILVDNAVDNSQTVSDNNRYLANVTLSGRKLFTDGNWNTLCLPFNLSDEQIADSPLADATIMELDTDESGFEDGTLTLNFTTASDITAGTPYIIKWKATLYDANGRMIIKNTDDWDLFAAKVNGGQTALDAVLNADITGVKTMVGTDSYPYAGNFDGNGHTLSLSLTATEAIAAPFRYIRGATIHDVTIAGTINNSNKQNAGVAGFSYGKVTISNCVVNTSITSGFSGDSSNGGFIADIKSGSVTFNNCAFTGSLLGASATCFGGFVGWRSATNIPIAFNHCYLNPAEVTMSTTGSSTFNRNGSGGNTYDYCYYVTAYGDVQGTQTSATGDALQALFGDGWEVSGNDVVPVFTTVDLEENDYIVNPLFTYVTISDEEHPATIEVSGTKSVVFKGTYDYMSFANEDRSILFLGDENTLYWPQPDGNTYPSIGACRAYFKLKGLSAGEINATRLFFGGEVEETTSLPQPLQREGSQAGAWYTLDGRKLDGKPAKKGVYINNGHKVVIK